ncbi:MAG TPA: winged helix-turn-helix domain-containing protein [Holophagaceae bacterium]|nr:winged helix-turn-helix domain-containing protein [Holophagaceae bacterium]
MRYRFEDFELDPAAGELRRQGAPVPLEPQVFTLLQLLVANADRLVSRAEVLEQVWEGRAVTDSAVDSRLKALRRALGDDGATQRLVRTVHGRGFRFAGAVTIEAAAGPSPDLGGRPSLAVLPFQPLGDLGPYAAVADALPHELIAELARLRWLLVTARGSAFRLRDPALDPVTVGRLLGVGYLLRGAVELEGRRLALAVSLVDARDGALVWAERFTGDLADVHGLRAELRGRLLVALELRIPEHEVARTRLSGTEDLDAWAAYHRALDHMYRFNREDNAAARALFDRALALDPRFARAHAGRSFLHFQTAFMRHTEDLEAETRAARACAERGLELDPRDPFVNFTYGRSYWLEGDLDTSLQWLERATELSPHYAQGIYARAWTEAMAARPEPGRAHADLAMRLSPLDPLYYAMLGTRAFTHLAAGEDVEGAAWADRAARSPGAHVIIPLIAAGAHALAGHAPEAAHWADQVRARREGLTRADFFRSFPLRDPELRKRLDGALARLGF